MAHYLSSCGRADIQVLPLYEKSYAPRKGDLIVLEPSRRFIETQKFFDAMRQSGMSHRDIQVGPIVASTIYEFEPTTSAEARAPEQLMLTQLQDAPGRFEAVKDTNRIVSSWLSKRGKQ